MNTLRPRALLALILVLYFALAALFAVRTPAWQAPDEPAHYNYVRYLTEKGQFPVLHMGDYPHAYLEQIKAAGFPAGMSIDPIRYEFHQPPLYYALLAPVYALAGGSLLALRLASVLLGAGVVLLAYAIGRRAFPARPGLALGAAAFVAFLPQHLATVSQVGNDVLAELLFALVLYVLVGWVSQAPLRDPASARRQPASDALPGASNIQHPVSIIHLSAAGFLLGLILITKTTAYIAAPLVAGVLLWRWRRERAGFRRIVGEGLAVILPAALVALPWYARNIAVYGWPDFLGLQRHDAIVVGQMRLADFVAQSGWAAYWRRAVEWTFKSFVGVFGWMGVWLDTRVYLALALLGGLAAGGHLLRVVGLARSAGRGAAPPPDETAPRNAAHLLALSALLTLLVYAWYNTQFLQHQGRYLFTALIPIALAFAAGWDRVVQPGAGRWLAGGLAALAAALAAWGVRAGAGLPKWPVAIAIAAGAGLLLLDLALTLFGGRQRNGPAARRFLALVRAAASAFPYAFLALAALYALLGAIVPLLA